MVFAGAKNLPALTGQIGNRSSVSGTAFAPGTRAYRDFDADLPGPLFRGSSMVHSRRGCTRGICLRSRELCSRLLC